MFLTGLIVFPLGLPPPAPNDANSNRWGRARTANHWTAAPGRRCGAPTVRLRTSGDLSTLAPVCWVEMRDTIIAIDELDDPMPPPAEESQDREHGIE
jgi:hypothetical protein